MAAAKKSVKKSAKSAKKSAPALVPRPNGRGALLAGGMPGNRGGGRPADAFKAMCRELASSAQVEQSVREILTDPSHPAYLGALKWASDHGYGKPKEHIEHSGTVGLQQLIVESMAS